MYYIYIFQVCQICQFTYLSEFYVLGSTFIRGSVNTHLCKEIYIFYLRMKAKLKQFEKKEKRRKKHDRSMCMFLRLLRSTRYFKLVICM